MGVMAVGPRQGGDTPLCPVCIAVGQLCVHKVHSCMCVVRCGGCTGALCASVGRWKRSAVAVAIADVTSGPALGWESHRLPWSINHAVVGCTDGALEGIMHTWWCGWCEVGWVLHVQIGRLRSSLLDLACWCVSCPAAAPAAAHICLACQYLCLTLRAHISGVLAACICVEGCCCWWQVGLVTC